MRPRSIAVTAATLIAAASLSPVTASADSQNILYVNDANAACTDSGTGTSAAPFCSLQTAASMANPGDTVDIVAGMYNTTTVITRSGTPDAPIVFDGNANANFVGGAKLTGIHLSHASNIRIENVQSGGVVVDGGSDITLAHDFSPTTSGGLQVTDSAANVTVLDSRLGGRVVVNDGATGTVLSTNEFDNLSIVGATDTAVTGNTISDCNLAPISVTGSASGTRLENNIVNGALNGCALPNHPYGVDVDASSAPGTTSDYNDVYAGGSAAYNWAGTPYTTATALYAATGQAQHDDNSLAGTIANEGSPAVNSADSSAVGEQSVDFNGNPRVLDPLVKPTGAGPHDDYDRGAVQFQDPLTPVTKSFTASATQVPVGATITLHAAMTDTWSDTVTYRFQTDTTLSSDTDGNFTTSVSTSGPHNLYVYATPANGSPTAVTPFGYLLVRAVPAAPLVAKQTLSSYDARSVTASDSGTTDSWNIAGVSFDFGDGTPAATADVYNNGTLFIAPHTYAKAGTYKVTETVTDAGGNTASTTSSFTTNAPAAGTALVGTRSAAGAWQNGPWPSPPGATGIAQSAITALPNGTAQLVAVTTTGTVELDIRNADGTWRGWHNLAQPGVTVKSVGIAGMPDNSTQFIEVTTTGTLLQQIRTETGAWQPGWTNPTGSTGVTQAAITAMPDGTSQLVAVTTAGKLLHNIRYTNGTYRGWHTLTQTGVTIKDASIAGMPDGSSQITEVTSTGLLNLIARKANGSWLASGWSKIGTTATQTSIAALPNGSTLFEAVTNTGTYDTNVRNTNGTWQGWELFAATYLGTITNGSITGQRDGTALITAVTAG